MISIDQHTTIGDAFARAAIAYAQRPFLTAPAGAHRSYHRGRASNDSFRVCRFGPWLFVLWGTDIFTETP